MLCTPSGVPDPRVCRSLATAAACKCWGCPLESQRHEHTKGGTPIRQPQPYPFLAPPSIGLSPQLPGTPILVKALDDKGGAEMCTDQGPDPYPPSHTQPPGCPKGAKRWIPQNVSPNSSKPGSQPFSWPVWWFAVLLSVFRITFSTLRALRVAVIGRCRLEGIPPFQDSVHAFVQSCG